jgi:hypothetical protein
MLYDFHSSSLDLLLVQIIHFWFFTFVIRFTELVYMSAQLVTNSLICDISVLAKQFVQTSLFFHQLYNLRLDLILPVVGQSTLVFRW